MSNTFRLSYIMEQNAVSNRVAPKYKWSWEIQLKETVLTDICKHKG